MAFLSTSYIKKLIIVTVAVAVVISLSVVAHAKQVRTPEHKFRAEFITNFMNHVFWDLPNDPIRNICVIGDDPMTPHLRYLIRKNGRSHLQVLRKYIDDDFAACHLVYTGYNQFNEIDRVILKTQSRHILTVSSIKDFVKKGGHVEFLIRNQKVELHFNISALENSGIKISDDLLSLSDTINDR